MPIILPIALLGLGVAALVILATSSEDPPVPVHEPDLSPAPSGSTGYKLVDAILPQLRAASASSGVPLGVLVGWIAKESGGRLGEVTKLDERGLAQLMPAESARLGLDHQRLSTDLIYSINAALALIGYYMGDVDKLGVAQRGTDYYWKLVKLCHTMGNGATKKIVSAAQAAGAAGSWATLEKFALANNAEMLHETKHSPQKWFPFVDAVAEVGQPFGFGSSNAIVGASVVPGGKIFDDIVDPLDALDT